MTNTQNIDIYEMNIQKINEFEVVGIMAEGNLLELIKALYGLPISGNRWHAHLSHISGEMGLI